MGLVMILAGIKLKAAMYANDRKLSNRTIAELLGVSEETIQQTLRAYKRTHPAANTRLKKHSREWTDVVYEVATMAEQRVQPGMCAMATGEPYVYNGTSGTVYVRADGVSLPYVKGLYEVRE